jgi:hypothetical protein
MSRYKCWTGVIPIERRKSQGHGWVNGATHYEYGLASAAERMRLMATICLRPATRAVNSPERINDQFLFFNPAMSKEF